MQTTPKLTDTQTLRTARSILEAHLPLEASGYKCQAGHLYDAILATAAGAGTLEAVCRQLPGMPTADTLRAHLKGQLTLEALPGLQGYLNAALSQKMPPRFLRKPQRIAIDFHDQPDDGKAEQDEAKWVRARARDDTTRFLRIATAYIIHRGRRLMLCAHYVMPEDTMLDVVKSLLGRITALQVKIGCLLLDKGFSGISVMQYLDQQNVPAIIACPIRGKKAPEPSATRALCQGRGSYSTSYTFSKSQTWFTARLAVCRVFTTSRRTGRMQRRGSCLVFIMIGKPLRYLSCKQVRRLYKKRFGVETSYRLSKQLRGWTPSSSSAYRFVLIGLSCFMVNVWVHLCWLYTQVARRGGRYLDADRFRLQRYAKFIMQALERQYGRGQEIFAPAVPLP